MRAWKRVHLDAGLLKDPQVHTAHPAQGWAPVWICGNHSGRERLSKGKQDIAKIGGRQHGFPVCADITLFARQVQYSNTERNQRIAKEVDKLEIIDGPRMVPRVCSRSQQRPQYFVVQLQKKSLELFVRRLGESASLPIDHQHEKHGEPIPKE